jgi:hypothetical protein
VWTKDIAASSRDAELAWLKGEVHGGEIAEVEVETISARRRYSRRPGKKERVGI